MNRTPRATVIRAPGTNCDAEMCRAFELAGASVRLVHIDRLIERPSTLEDADLIGFPGGFSYGDDIASGRILAARLRDRLYASLRKAAERGVPMIGACNGFQVLVQVGLLPGPASGEKWPQSAAPAQRCALTHNQTGRFIDRWVRVRIEASTVCVWTRGLHDGWSDQSMMLPIAHGEGRFVAESPDLLASLRQAGQVAIRYAEPVNGSDDDIAGICDLTGRIFGLMPHPERYLDWRLHPFWTRLDEAGRSGRREPPGLLMFRNAVAAAAEVAVS